MQAGFLNADLLLFSIFKLSFIGATIVSHHIAHQVDQLCASKFDKIKNKKRTYEGGRPVIEGQLVSVQRVGMDSQLRQCNSRGGFLLNINIFL